MSEEAEDGDSEDVLNNIRDKMRSRFDMDEPCCGLSIDDRPPANSVDEDDENAADH